MGDCVAPDDGAGPLLSDRLMAMLREEIAALERREPPAQDGSVARGADAVGLDEAGGAGEAASAPGAKATAGAKAGARKPAAGGAGAGGIGSKERIDAIGQLTRILEKLLELKRIEAMAMQSGAQEDDAEAERLRVEMMKRLRALDARRRAGATLFADGVEGFAPLAEAHA